MITSGKTNGTRRIIACALLCCLSLVTTGCTQEVAAEIAALSGTYLGDVVASVTTGYLQQIWGIEAEHEHEEDEHSHESEAMHEHDH